MEWHLMRVDVGYSVVCRLDEKSINDRQHASKLGCRAFLQHVMNSGTQITLHPKGKPAGW